MKNKIIYIAMAIAIILGIVVAVTKGFNVSLINSDHKRIDIMIGNEYNISDMKKIVKDSIKGNAVVRKATVFGTSVAIDVNKNVSDEEITNLVNKINEKYGKQYGVKDIKFSQVISEMNLNDALNLTDDEINQKISEIKEKYNLEYTKEELTDTTPNITIYNVQRIRLFDVVKEFAIPVLIALIISLIFSGIRFRKLKKKAFIKVPALMLLRLAIVEMFLASVIAITRIPVNSYTLAVLLLIGVIYMFAMNLQYEKENNSKNNDKSDIVKSEE